MFDGTLGDWSTEPVNLDLKPGSRPFNSKYYTFPRINKERIHKYLKRLVEIGVLTPAQQSQYSTPVFIISKKEGTVRFITDYRRLNQQLVRKPYPLHIIGETMQQLEELQYTTSLDLNMVYYNIKLYPASQDRTTIITEFGKLRFNRLLMINFASGYIFSS